jgi:deoxycytidylate deaminase
MINTPNLYNTITQQARQNSKGFYSCVKQPVQAMIVTSDKTTKIYGMNKIINPITTCPRVEQDMKTGEGYHLCHEVCNQQAHAEVDAIMNAKKQNIDIHGSTLYLAGHTYCCDNCLEQMYKSGVKKVFVIAENNSVFKYYEL